MAKKPTGHLTRRTLLATAGKATVAAMAAPFVDLASAEQAGAAAQAALPLTAIAGVDRVVMRHGRTYLQAWAGYGSPPQRGRRPSAGTDQPAPPPLGQGAKLRWSKRSGPGTVTFADASAPATTAVFAEPGSTCSSSRPRTVR